MQRIQAEEDLEVLRPELGTKPRVYYKNLHRITKCFVGGTVVEQADGVEECAAGAEVVLKRTVERSGGRRRTSSVSSPSTGSSPDSGGYQLEVTGSSGSFSTEFELGDDSPYLGVMTSIGGIVLRKAGRNR